MPIYFEANLDGSIEQAPQYKNFYPKTIISNCLAVDDWQITSSSSGRSSILELTMHKNGETRSFLIHASKIHNQEESRRNKEEKRIQISPNSSTTLYKYSPQSSPIGLVLGVYKREVFNDTIICAWPLDAIPSAGSRDS